MPHDRWTQCDDDSSRLPEGFKRIGYDSDTKRYTFRDSKTGALYHGEPGADYGVLTPVPPSTSSMDRSRPSAFASPVDEYPPQHHQHQHQHHRSPSLSPSPSPNANGSPPPKTFQEILPPELMTTSTLSESGGRGKRASASLSSNSNSNSNSKSPRVQFVDVVRRAALPKMQGVVHSLRRTLTALKKPVSRSGLPGMSGDRDGGLGRGRGYEYMNMNSEHEHESVYTSASRGSLDHSASTAPSRADCSHGSVLAKRPVSRS